MFYTLGNPDIYEEYLSNDPHPMKLGRKNDYIGGSIFRSQEDAKKFLKKNRIPFNVYGVVVQEKDIDFSKEKENGFGDLLVDSLLIRIKK